MSQQNKHASKAYRRSTRTAQKARARAIPFSGVQIGANVVRQHQYRAVRGLPHSPTTAVKIQRPAPRPL
jgi:hypothetical protein